MKRLWTVIKSIIDVRKSNGNVIAKIKDSNGDVISDPAVIDNVVNKFSLMCLVMLLSPYLNLQSYPCAL